MTLLTHLDLGKFQTFQNSSVKGWSRRRDQKVTSLKTHDPKTTGKKKTRDPTRQFPKPREVDSRIRD